MEQRNFLSAGTAGSRVLTRDDLVRALEFGRAGKQRSDHATASLIAAEKGQKPLGAMAPRSLTPAAVLVPLVAREDGMSVLLTQRTAHLIHHGGQISFPGGRMEENDASPEAAALRESEEEIGLAGTEIDLLGRLDDYITITGFHVVPVVGLLSPPLSFTPDPFEVAEIFEVPLSFVMDPANHQRQSRKLPSGEDRWYYVLPYQERFIWGATAAMLVNLCDVLTPIWTS